MQTVHQNSVHENPGFVAVVLAKYESNGEEYFTRCNGAFLDKNIIVTAGHCLEKTNKRSAKTNKRSVDGKQVENRSLGKIVSVEAAAFPTNGIVGTRSATAWFRSGDVALVYFRNGFQSVGAAVQLPLTKHIDMDENAEKNVRYYMRNKTRLSYFNPMFGEKEFRNKNDVLP